MPLPSLPSLRLRQLAPAQASVFCAFVAALCSAAAGRPAKDVAVAPFSLSLSGTIVPQSVSSPFIDHYEDPSQGSCRSDEKVTQQRPLPPPPSG